MPIVKVNKQGGILKKLSLLVPVVALLALPLLGWNNIVAIPAWIALGAVFISRSNPGDPLFEMYVKASDWGAKRIIREDPEWHFEIVEGWKPEDFSFDKLKKLSRGFTTPVVFRGLAKGMTHLEDWGRPEYFAEKYGNTTLLSVQNSLISSQKAAAANASEYGSTGNDKGVFRTIPLKLGEAIEGMLEGKNYYFQNVDQLIRANPEIMDHMELPNILKNWKDGRAYVPNVINFFLGFGRGDPTQTLETTGSALHAAMPANLFFMYSGRKLWWFIQPKWTPFILGHFSHFIPAAFGRRIPDFVPKASVVLGPGDVMFNPSYMWHEVRNYDGWCVAAATRLIFPWAMVANNPFAYIMLDLFGNPFGFTADLYKDKPIKNFILNTPILRTLAIFAKGDAAEPEFSPARNNCDEHNMDNCLNMETSLLKKEHNDVTSRDD